LRCIRRVAAGCYLRDIAVIRKAATGSVPGLLVISAVVLTVQTAMVLAAGELGINRAEGVVGHGLASSVSGGGSRWVT
jgi:hypothetical protein